MISDETLAECVSRINHATEALNAALAEIEYLRAENAKLFAVLNDPAERARLARIQGTDWPLLFGERRNVVADGPGPDWPAEVSGQMNESSVHAEQEASNR